MSKTFKITLCVLTVALLLLLSYHVVTLIRSYSARNPDGRNYQAFSETRAVYLAAQTVTVKAKEEGMDEAEVFSEGLMTDAYKTKLYQYLDTNIIKRLPNAIIEGSYAEGVTRVVYRAGDNKRYEFMPDKTINVLD